MNNAKIQTYNTPKALFDIQEAINYYNEKKFGLGKRFFKELQQEFQAIQKNPQHRSIRYSNIRLAHLDHFPYAAHFEFDEKIITVNAVLCDFQNSMMND